jgi:hypothetical protein
MTELAPDITTTDAPEFTCGVDGCDFEVAPEKRDHAPQSLAMHRNRIHGIRADKPRPNGVAKRKPKAKHFDAFLQEQNVETATAYVVAAKWPTGIPIEDIPRVIKLVKAVEHG